MNSETAKTTLSLLEEEKDFAWATILDTRGSTPRHAGAAMLVEAGGSITGTIGGGPLEAIAIQRSLEVIKTGGFYLERFDATQLGMACGGGGILLIERVDPSRQTVHDLFRGLAGLLESGRRGWLITVIPEGAWLESADCATPGSAIAGSQVPHANSFVRRCLVNSDASIAGDLICAPEDLRELAKRGGTYDRIVAGDPTRIYVEPVGAQGTAYVFGAGHCGQRLAPVLGGLGFFTVVIDDRPDFANCDRFPTADRIVVPESFEDVVETLPIDRDSYIVIVTRGHSHDTTVLAQSLRTEARYIGMIGSNKKVAGAFKTLTEAGFSADDLARIHAPIGLTIGAETPEEIAISIAAEMIQTRASKD